MSHLFAPDFLLAEAFMFILDSCICAERGRLYSEYRETIRLIFGMWGLGMQAYYADTIPR